MSFINLINTNKISKIIRNEHTTFQTIRHCIYIGFFMHVNVISNYRIETANAVIMTLNGWKQNNKGVRLTCIIKEIIYARSMHWLTEDDKSAKNSIIYSVHAEIYLISRPAPTAHNYGDLKSH